MEKYRSVLMGSVLFSGIGEEEILPMLNCLQARVQHHKKGEYVLRAGEPVRHITLLAEGALHIQRDDYWGNRSIISTVGVGEMFGEAYVAPDSGPLPGDVVAVEDSVTLSFDVRRILTVCSSACQFHTRLIQNLFFAISEKNRLLVQKLGHMSKRFTRDKLLSYLSEQARRHNSNTFIIPFNRQQLADFLSVDRSAMSNELCKLRDEGLLIFERNKFTLL